MQEIGFEAQFDGDGGVVGGLSADAVVVGPSHRVEASGVMGEGDCEAALWRPPPPLSLPKYNASAMGHAVSP